jgi:multidrug resistance efflux pump
VSTRIDQDRPRVEAPSHPAGNGKATAVEREVGGRGATVAAPRVVEPRREPGSAVPEATPRAAPRAAGRRRRLLLLIPILLLVGALSLTVGYRYWYESTYFVITDNAQVAGDLVQVGSLNAGRLVAARVEVGEYVRKDQELALVAIPQQVGATPFGNAPRMDVTGTSDSLVPVRAPVAGLVAARTGAVGSTVSAGQSIYALVDPQQVWVRANVEETKVARVRPGQAVEVHVDALGRSFAGQVVAVTPASAATFSLLPVQNVSGNFIKVTQLVPVKIAVYGGEAALPLGTSATVRIRVREPGGGLPWQP